MGKRKEDDGQGKGKKGKKRGKHNPLYCPIKSSEKDRKKRKVKLPFEE